MRLSGLRVRFAPPVLALLFGVAFAAWGQSDSSNTYTRAQIRLMVRQAHTPDQYKALATVFRDQQGVYQRQAEASLREYEKYKTTTHPKTPTAADNARSWQAYYSGKADHAAALASKYESLAAVSRNAPAEVPLTKAVAVHGQRCRGTRRSSTGSVRRNRVRFAEPVTEVGIGQQVFRSRRVVLQLLPELADKRTKVLDLVRVLATPDGPQ